MLQVFPAPPEARAWLEAGVCAGLPAGLSHSCFPAVPHAMLTVQLAPRPGPVMFHTLSTRPSRFEHTGPLLALGWLVNPAAAACLLGHGSGVMVNQVLPWSVIAGEAEARRLDDALAEATGPAACLAALAASLQRAMQRALRPNVLARGLARGLAQGMTHAPTHGVARDQAAAQLCAQVGRWGAQAGAVLGLGQRQLERRCRAWLGVSPKQFQRLTRAHLALAQALDPVRPAATSGADLALQMGYYDQSHFGREMRVLTGAPLSTLLAEARQDGPWWSLASRQALQGLRAVGKRAP